MILRQYTVKLQCETVYSRSSYVPNFHAEKGHNHKGSPINFSLQRTTSSVYTERRIDSGAFDTIDKGTMSIIVQIRTGN